jgi:hypothetical protein
VAEAAPPQQQAAAAVAAPEREEAAQPPGPGYGHAYDARFDPRYDPRFDPRFDPRYDPRLDPRFDPRYAEVGPQGPYPQQVPQPPQGQGDARVLPQPQAGGAEEEPPGSPWFHAPRLPERPQPEPGQEPDADRPRIPTGPQRDRPLGVGAAVNGVNGGGPLPFPGQRTEEYAPAPEPEPEPEPEPAAVAEPAAPTFDLPDGVSVEEAYFGAYRQYVREQGHFPNARQFSRYLPTVYGGTAPEERTLVAVIRDMRYRFQSESDVEHIP